MLMLGLLTLGSILTKEKVLEVLRWIQGTSLMELGSAMCKAIRVIPNENVIQIIWSASVSSEFPGRAGKG